MGFRVDISRAVSHVATVSAPFASIAMVLKGRTRARIISCGEDCDISPGPNSVGLFGPQLNIDRARWECEPGAERLAIGLDFSVLERAGDLETMLPPRRELRQDMTLIDPQLASMMRLIATEVRRSSPHGALYANSLSLALAAYLLNQHAIGGRVTPRERGALRARQKTAVLDLIQDRLSGNLDLDDMAAAAGVSRFHFLRLFKNTFGVTPHRFVLDRRIEAAARLLEHTTLSLVEVAAQTGFSSQSHLGSAMQRCLGRTPGQYRRDALPVDRNGSSEAERRGILR